MRNTQKEGEEKLYNAEAPRRACFKRRAKSILSRTAKKSLGFSDPEVIADLSKDEAMNEFTDGINLVESG